MKLEITEEDHRFIESIVQRFDPALVPERPAGVSDEDWTTYLAPLRGDLRLNLEEAMIAQALKDAGVIQDARAFTADFDRERAKNESRNNEAWDRAYERVTAHWTSFKDEDKFLAAVNEATEQALAVVGAVV